MSEVVQRESGLAVVLEDAESVRVEARKARRVKNRAKRLKAAKRLSARQNGKVAWKARAKRIGKTARYIQRQHGLSPEEAKRTAKCAVHVTDAADRMGY